MAKLGDMNFGEGMTINPTLQFQWMTHNRDYTKIMMNLDGTQPPLMTSSIVMSMDKALMDVHDNLKLMKHPYLIFIGDKDKIVDNEGAIAFHKGTATPANKKDLKQF